MKDIIFLICLFFLIVSFASFLLLDVKAIDLFSKQTPHHITIANVTFTYSTNPRAFTPTFKFDQTLETKVDTVNPVWEPSLKAAEFCPVLLENRLLECQKSSKQPVTSFCHTELVDSKTSKFKRGTCHGLSDRLRNILWTLYSSLEDCRPYILDWPEHSVAMINHHAISTNPVPLDEIIQCEDISNPSRFQWWPASKSIGIESGCGMNPRWSSIEDLVRNETLFHTLPFGFEMGCLFHLTYTMQNTLRFTILAYQQRMRDQMAAGGYSKIIGVHIRAGDRCLVDSDDSRAKYGMKGLINTKMALDCADELENAWFGTGEAMYYIASDCEPFRVEIQSQNSSKFFLVDFPPSHIGDKLNPTDQLSSWAELLLLATVDAMVITRSSYGLTAAKIGFLDYRKIHVCGKPPRKDFLLPTFDHDVWKNSNR